MESYPEAVVGVVERRGRQTRSEVVSLIGRSVGALVHVEILRPEIAEANLPTERAEIVLELIDLTRDDDSVHGSFGMPTTFMLNLADYCATNTILSVNRHNRGEKYQDNETVVDRHGRKVFDRLIDVRHALRQDLFAFVEAHADGLQDPYESRWFMADLEQRLAKIMSLIQPGWTERHTDTSLIRGMLAECMILYHARECGFSEACFSRTDEDRDGIDLWIGYESEDLQGFQVKSRLRSDPALRLHGVRFHRKVNKCPQITLVDWDPRDTLFLPEDTVESMSEFIEEQLAA